MATLNRSEAEDILYLEARVLDERRYEDWLAMLTAGTLGTAGGDFVADELGLGVGYGSLVLFAVFLIVVIGATRIGKMGLFWYWGAIVAARTAGTTMGDFLPSRRGLDLGLPLSTAITLTALAAIILVWRDRQTMLAAEMP